MNQPVKLLFDECVGAHIASALGDFLRRVYPEPHEVRHFFEFQRAQTPDEIWIPQMTQLGFIAVTADRGKGKGKKLPLLCVKYGMTHIILLHSVHTMNSEKKIRAILALWDQIVDAGSEPRGSRFFISAAGPELHPKMRQVVITDEERAIAAKYDDGNSFRLS